MKYYKKIEYKGKQLKRITRRKAENILQHPKQFDGVTVYTLPINANPNSPWIDGFFEIANSWGYRDAVDNINELNEIEYYNCGDELGKYLKFYIEEDAKC